MIQGTFPHPSFLPELHYKINDYLVFDLNWAAVYAFVNWTYYFSLEPLAAVSALPPHVLLMTAYLCSLSSCTSRNMYLCSLPLRHLQEASPMPLPLAGPCKVSPGYSSSWDTVLLRSAPPHYSTTSLAVSAYSAACHVFFRRADLACWPSSRLSTIFRPSRVAF